MPLRHHYLVVEVDPNAHTIRLADSLRNPHFDALTPICKNVRAILGIRPIDDVPYTYEVIKGVAQQPDVVSCGVASMANLSALLARRPLPAHRTEANLRLLRRYFFAKHIIAPHMLLEYAQAVRRRLPAVVSADFIALLDAEVTARLHNLDMRLME